MTSAHGLFVLANCYTLAGFIIPGGSDRINWASFFHVKKLGNRYRAEDWEGGNYGRMSRGKVAILFFIIYLNSIFLKHKLRT